MRDQHRGIDAAGREAGSEPLHFVRTGNGEEGRAQAEFGEPARGIGYPAPGFAAASGGKAFFSQPGQRRKTGEDEVDEKVAHHHDVALFFAAHASGKGHSPWRRAQRR